MNQKSIIYIGIALILLIGGILLWQNQVKVPIDDGVIPTPTIPTEPTPPTPTQPTTPVEPIKTPQGWKTYENIKYNYGFSYPSSYYIWQLEGIGVPSEITEDADNASVGEEKNINAIFGVQATTLRRLDAASIKARFGGNMDPEDLDLITTMVAGELAYRLEFKKEDKMRVSDFYFVENFNNQVLEITLLINNAIADKILSSLRFTK